MTFANALGATMAIVFVVCRVLVGIFPALSLAIAQSWFHMIPMERMNAGSLSAPAFVLGLVSATISAWLAGYLFATVYNSLAKK